MLRNFPNCIIFDNWVFENFILVNEPFSKALLVLKTCALINKNLWGKLVSSIIHQPQLMKGLKLSECNFVFLTLTL